MSVREQASNAEPEQWHQDPALLDRLVALLVRDHRSLRDVAPLLSADDFKPSRGVPGGRARWLVAERALEHWEKHQDPIGDLLRADVLEYAASLRLGADQVTELKAYMKA